MRPTTLHVRGLKSWADHELELGHLTAIQGTNGSGKTALIQAIRLALLGYDPEVGRQLQATRKLVNAEVGLAEVGLTFDTGFGIRRVFGDKSEVQVMPSRGESTGRACQERINEETGGVVVSLDLSTYLELSDEKRRAWLFEHLPTDAAVLDWERFAKWTDAEEGALADVVRTLWEQTVTKAPSLVGGLGAAIEVAHAQALEADRRRQDQAKALALSDARIRELVTPDEEEDPDALEQIGQRIAGLNQRIGEARAGREAREAIEGRIRKGDETLAKLRDEVERLRVRHAGFCETLEATEEPAAMSEELQGALGATDAERARVGPQLIAARERMTELAAAAGAIRLRKEELERHGPCPYVELGCAVDLEDLRATRLGEMAAELADADTEHGRAKARHAELAVEYDAIATERGRLREKDSELASQRRTYAGLERDVGASAVRLRELEERCELRVAELAAARAELAALQGDDELAGLYDARDAAESQRAAILARQEARTKHATIVEEHERQGHLLEALTKKAADLKELDGNLRRLRADVIRQMVEPLEGAAAEILGSMDAAKVFRFVFERENRAILDFGFEEDGTLRLFDAASKGERAMLTVAFLGAILATLAPPLRLLVIDDVEQLDRARRRGLLGALTNMADRWDAVVVAGACDLEADIEAALAGAARWKLVDLERVEVAA